MEHFALFTILGGVVTFIFIVLLPIDFITWVFPLVSLAITFIMYVLWCTFEELRNKESPYEDA